MTAQPVGLPPPKKRYVIDIISKSYLKVPKYRAGRQEFHNACYWQLE
jgi:hypothetical protein